PTSGWRGGSTPPRPLATASEDGTVRLWDEATGDPIGPPLRHGCPVRAIVFAPDGKRLLACDTEGRARFWTMRPEGQERPDPIGWAEAYTGSRLGANDEAVLAED
ncbi:MAG: hypothetical protein K2W96_27465, partial [Gemmataceae bacterium]|nr:hypothetical protein [Gemmataceae bacterium]